MYCWGDGKQDNLRPYDVMSWKFLSPEPTSYSGPPYSFFLTVTYTADLLLIKKDAETGAKTSPKLNVGSSADANVWRASLRVQTNKCGEKNFYILLRLKLVF